MASDSSYSIFWQYGTHAERLLFTPVPPQIAGVDVKLIYGWYETDTGSTFLYDTSWHQVTSSGTLPATVQGDILYASGVNTVVALAKNASATRYLSNTGASNNPAWDQVNLANGVIGVLPTTGLGAGAVVQVVNALYTTKSTGTTAVPVDDTIPQKTEGDEYFTLAITPKATTNKLRIDVIIYVAHSTSGIWLFAGVFQDTANDALAGGFAFSTQATGITNGAPYPISFTHYMAAGTTSSTTFKVRAGGATGATLTVNGSSGSRLYGGVITSSITITEIAV